MKSVNFSPSNLPNQWQYVKRNLREMGMLDQAGADSLESQAQRVLEGFFQRSIDAEFQQQLKADWYEHSEERADVRSGTYPRVFTTAFGRTKLLIPKVRKKSQEYVYQLFTKYQRRQKKFDDMIVLSLLLGFSTRKQQRFFQAFIGDSVSHRTASQLLGNLSEELRAYQTRPIEDKYRFVFLDGLWVHIKEIDIKKRPILFALGVTKEGRQEIIAFKLAQGETEEEYTAFLNDLYRRGLKGQSLELIIQDGSEAITAAVNTIYPYVSRQRCYTHKLRNLLQNIRHKRIHRPKMAQQASHIYKASSRQEATRRFRIFVNRWKNVEPRAVRCFQDEFYQTLNFYDFPKEIRSAISTTNHLERFLEEIRRRIKIQGYFRNEHSLNLWIFGLIKHINLRPIQQPKSMLQYKSAK